MNVVVRVDAPPLANDMPRVARVEVFRDLDAAEPLWRPLESEFATPFQRFDFLAAWQRNVGAAEGREPRIVVALDDTGQPLCVVPLAVSDGRLACFMGGKHCNFNMALWRRDTLGLFDRAELNNTLATLADHGVKALALGQQPRHWRGIENPFYALPHQASVNECPLLTFTQDSADNERISGSTRRRLKSKERKLQSLKGYRYLCASTPQEINRALEAFFVIKPQRMALQNLPDVFADPGVDDFIREICDTSSGKPAVVIHTLECDDEVIAIFTGVEDGQRFSMMFNTYTLSENARYSPGLILVRHIIDHYAARGFTSLDLGVGLAHYKTMFCKQREELFDSFIPLTAAGWPLATTQSLLHRLKYNVKRSETLTRLANGLRARLRGGSVTPPPSEDQA